jgi:hypothetical protein
MQVCLYTDTSHDEASTLICQPNAARAPLSLEPHVKGGGRCVFRGSRRWLLLRLYNAWASSFQLGEEFFHRAGGRSSATGGEAVYSFVLGFLLCIFLFIPRTFL